MTKQVRAETEVINRNQANALIAGLNDTGTAWRQTAEDMPETVDGDTSTRIQSTAHVVYAGGTYTSWLYLGDEHPARTPRWHATSWSDASHRMLTRPTHPDHS